MIILFHVLEFKSYELGSLRDFVGGKRIFVGGKTRNFPYRGVLNQGKGEISLINQYGGEELIYGLYFMLSCFMVDMLCFVLYD